MSSLIINYCFQILQYYITPVNDFTDLIVTTDLSNIVSRSVFTIVAFLGRVRQRALGKLVSQSHKPLEPLLLLSLFLFLDLI